MASENAHLLVSLTLSTVTREQYVEQSKERALALLRVGLIHEAVSLNDDGHAETPELRSASRNPRDRHLCRRGWRYRRGARLHRGF